MSQTIPFPESVKATLIKLATNAHYVLAKEILARGAADELLLDSHLEAQVIINIARVELMWAVLMYPFWSDDHPRHDPVHESATDDVLRDIYEKTVSYIGQEFEINSSI